MNDDTILNEADARSELIHYVIQQLALSDKASIKSPNLLPSAVSIGNPYYKSAVATAFSPAAPFCPFKLITTYSTGSL